MLSRRRFISNGLLATGSMLVACNDVKVKPYFLSVNGAIQSYDLGFTLTHEHIMVDFIGADKVNANRYNPEDVQKKALPYLTQLKRLGCVSFFECTPAYIGRDVKILKKLSEDSGLNIFSNTGYYGAAKEKYLPAHAYTETDKQLAERWIKEYKDGIEGTGIKPGFIKTGVDTAPLSSVQEKLIHAAALTHLETGLTIAVHTGDGKAAMRELEILQEHGVDPSAWVWVHAQSEKDNQFHIEAAKKGGWVEFDGMSVSSLQKHVALISRMKKEGLIKSVLVSHDAGWYHVGEPNGGEFRDFTTVFTYLIPELIKNGFTQDDLNQIFITNPSLAFSIHVRRLS